MVIENCIFLDNTAQILTGGITLNGATLTVSNSIIKNTEGFSNEKTI
jgi:hypothetical protein